MVEQEEASLSDHSRSLVGEQCLVLGAGGFLGAHLCTALKDRDIRVRGFGRRILFQESVQGIEWHEGDFRDKPLLSRVIAGCDTVFHLIGATTPSTADTNRIADINANVISTLNLLDACVAKGVRQIIFVSSGGTVYGNAQCSPIPESAPTEPISSYGITKLTVEKYLAVYHRLYGLDYRILRVANAYGPYQLGTKHQGVVATFLRRALAHKAIEIWGDGQVIRDYVYAGDVAAALLLAAEHGGPSRLFNLGTGQGHSLIDVINVIGALIGKEVQIEWRPGRPVDVARNILDITLAGRELKWVPGTALSDGVSLTLDWMKSSLGA